MLLLVARRPRPLKSAMYLPWAGEWNSRLHGLVTGLTRCSLFDAVTSVYFADCYAGRVARLGRRLVRGPGGCLRPQMPLDRPA